MAKHALSINDEIARRLEGALSKDSPNRITATQLREWALEYLVEHDEEIVRFPEEAGKVHWDLWMMDARFEDALFAVLVFYAEEMEFFCGIGDSFKVRHFSGHDFPDDPAELFRLMREQFTISRKSLRVDRKQAEQWLGRSW